MLRRITIGMRLIYLIAFNSIVLTLAGAVALVSLYRSNEVIRNIHDNQLASSLHLADARSNQMVVRVLLDQVAFSPDSPEAANRIAAAASFAQKSDEAWAAYLALPRSQDEQRIATEVQAKRDAFFNDGIRPLVKALQEGDKEKISRQVLERVPALDKELNASGTTLSKLQLATATAEYEAAQENYRLLMRGITVFIAAGILLGALLAWRIRKSIVQPLHIIAEQFEKMAAGDLRAHIAATYQNEIGRLLEGLRRMQNSLSVMVTDLRGSSDLVATASRQIAMGNADLSQRTEEQASSLEETASSMEKLADAVKQNADHAHQASALATDASSIAAEGGKVVAQVVSTMSGISAASARIADITGVIEGIAFQTNILALNAAVEAARAGEEGRGFAVVAAEVRSLAQRSSVAAGEIKALISDSVTQVAEGSTLVDQAGATMTRIVDAIARVEHIMAEISAASNEQRDGINQISQAITQMDSITQQNAALVEEAAAAAESLEEQAHKMSDATAVFTVA